jgi:glyoxylase-like metal-dependent hydrolase (beta-lactamase superfamily II)
VDRTGEKSTIAAAPAAGRPSRPVPTWEVIAVRYATREGRLGEHFYGLDPHDDPAPLDFFMWVLRSGDRAILVDAGFTEEEARARGRTIVDPVPDVLRRVGIELGDVRETILTHLHYDHAGYVHALPRATFWLQDEEMRFWTGRHAWRAGFRDVVTPEDVVGVVRANFQGRVRQVAGDAEVAPGVTVHRTGGHSAGLQVVRVNTGAGTLVLASDAAHLYAHLEQDRPFYIVHSLAGMYDAFDRVRELAGPDGIWVPGHDPEVMRRFPSAGTGLEGVAVRLGQP